MSNTEEKLAEAKMKLAILTAKKARLMVYHRPIQEHVIMNLTMRIIETEATIDSLEGDLLLQNYTGELD
jgi:hypothetical protein